MGGEICKGLELQRLCAIGAKARHDIIVLSPHHAYSVLDFLHPKGRDIRIAAKGARDKDFGRDFFCARLGHACCHIPCVSAGKGVVERPRELARSVIRRIRKGVQIRER